MLYVNLENQAECRLGRPHPLTLALTVRARIHRPIPASLATVTEKILLVKSGKLTHSSSSAQ